MAFENYYWRESNSCYLNDLSFPHIFQLCKRQPVIHKKYPCFAGVYISSDDHRTSEVIALMLGNGCDGKPYFLQFSQKELPVHMKDKAALDLLLGYRLNPRAILCAQRKSIPENLHNSFQEGLAEILSTWPATHQVDHTAIMNLHEDSR